MNLSFLSIIMVFLGILIPLPTLIIFPSLKIIVPFSIVFSELTTIVALTKALLSSDREGALDDWQQSRMAYAKAAFQWSRDLGSYIGNSKKGDPTGFKADFYDNPNTLITQNASNQPCRYIKYYLTR